MDELKHMTLARSVLLRCEDEQKFRSLVESFHQEYKPRSATEKALVNTMATARWRLIRMCRIESVNVDAEYVKQIEPAVVPEDFGPADKAGLAYRDLTRNSRIWDVVGRAEGRLQRQFDSALAQLTKARTARGAVQDQSPQSHEELEDTDEQVGL